MSAVHIYVTAKPDQPAHVVDASCWCEPYVQLGNLDMPGDLVYSHTGTVAPIVRRMLDRGVDLFPGSEYHGRLQGSTGHHTRNGVGGGS